MGIQCANEWHIKGLMTSQHGNLHITGPPWGVADTQKKNNTIDEWAPKPVGLPFSGTGSPLSNAGYIDLVWHEVWNKLCKR